MIFPGLHTRRLIPWKDYRCFERQACRVECFLDVDNA